MSTAPPTLEGRLNQDCFCIEVDPARVWRALAAAAPCLLPDGLLARDRSGLFSSTPVFLSVADLARTSRIAQAIEAVAEQPAYQAAVLGWAPVIARFDPGPRGAFMSCDFHLTPAGPKLIEVNTNAGGAFLNALVAQAQVACCSEVEALTHPDPLARFEDGVWRMFQAEWRRQGRTGDPGVIAIVDDAPEDQNLYPEFLLAKAFFERRGARAMIADPRSLSHGSGRLRLGDLPIDLVYNRLVDFAFDGPAAGALRAAYLAGDTVATPNPRNHALLADKRNLTILSDPARLEALGVEPALREALAGLPRSRLVTAETADQLWAERNSLFFKPAAGHAGKAVYRGERITKGVWASILEGDYVAQDFAAPSQRRVKVAGDPQVRKMDVRLYTYAGVPLLAAARLYQG